MATFVLIHGAYQGGWIWAPVANRLRDAGHRVYAPSLDGCAERSSQVRPGITTETQADEIAELMRYEDLNDVVLVGTSSGGMVLCRVAEIASERVQRVVFADALALYNGETIRDVVSGAVVDPDAVSTGPAPGSMLESLSVSMDAEMAQWGADRFGPHPAAAFNRPVELNSFWDQAWDACVIWCRQAPNPGEAHQRRCAEHLNARWHELDTGHYPMLSTPDELTQLVLEG